MESCEKFSKLEKDKKTYRHVLKYLNCMIDGENPAFIDNMIQTKELDDHLKKVGNSESIDEKTAWIKKNGKGLRIYINSLKEIALFCFMDTKIHNEEISFITFCRIVDIWDENKNNLIESIRLEA